MRVRDVGHIDLVFTEYENHTSVFEGNKTLGHWNKTGTAIVDVYPNKINWNACW